ncbi:MAG: inosine/xanthosine triphosphatase [Chloroflexi bacterium]|nr:inosine/xanthosine triphosphatase [Chloroflexota bacterium]
MKPKLAVVGSTNPVKLEAVRRALEALDGPNAWHVLGRAVSSGVGDQPRSDQETRRGARQRARASRQLVPQADLWIGLEGGIERIEGMWYTFGWVAALNPAGHWGSARSAAFPLPPAVARLLDQGWELGPADDAVFGTQQSKQHLGAVGLVTEGRLTRADLYAQAALLALTPLWRPELYFPGGSHGASAG